MTRVSAIVSFSVLASACCCFGSGREEVPPGTPVSLTLTVVADTGPSPVDGFTVTFEHDRQRETHVVASGDTLTLSGLARDYYVFFVHTADGRGGYLGQVSYNRFTLLEPGENTVTVAVSGGALLTGRVTDATTGTGLEGATVNVATHDYGRDGGGPDTATTVTDADGVYVLGGLCRGTEAILVSHEGYAPVTIATHRFPTDCEHVASAVTIDVAMDPPPAATVTVDVLDGRPRFTRILPGSVADRAGLRAFDRVLEVPPEYDPSQPTELPTFLYWLLDVEHYDGGSLVVANEDGVERTVTITRPPNLRWPGD